MTSLFVLSWSVLTLAQTPDSTLQELAFYADAMTNTTNKAHRNRAGDIFRREFIKSLGQDNSFEASYDSIVWIRGLMSPDSTWRIFTWQVEQAEGRFNYYGLMQFGSGDLIQLQNTRRLNSEYASYDQNTWYGAVYYGIEGFEMEDGSEAYILLGFNAKDDKTNIKVADVMTYRDGRLTFGAPIFSVPVEGREDDVKSRLIIEYADASVGRIQFDREKNRLIYDHVIVIDGGPEGPVYVPDGSYHAFEYKNRKWKYIDKVYNQSVEEPPGEGLKRDDLDIIGRKKN